MTDSSLNAHDLALTLRRVPKDVRDLVSSRGLYIAGGLIRATVAGEEVSDIDILAPSSLQAQAAADALKTIRGDKARMFRTRNAYTIVENGRTPVQFIHRWTFEDPTSLIDSFDYTIAQAVIWMENMIWRSQVSPKFYEDLAARRLRYLSPIRHEEAGGSILRMQKFLRRGYSIAPEDMGRVIARLVMGVHGFAPDYTEEMVAKVLKGLLRQVDPLTILEGVPVEEDEEDEVEEIGSASEDLTEI